MRLPDEMQARIDAEREIALQEKELRESVRKASLSLGNRHTRRRMKALERRAG